MKEDRFEQKVAKNIVAKVEQQFNTKVYRFGVAQKETKEFEGLEWDMGIAPKGTEFLFWFLIPIDDADNVITNNYYEKALKMKNSTMLSNSIASSEFQSILKQDWDVSSFIQKITNCQVYDTGAMSSKQYNVGDNILPDADKMEDLRYRFFRFYAPTLE